MDSRITGSYENLNAYSVTRASAAKTAGTDSVSDASSKTGKENPAAVYEKSNVRKAATYSVNKMSKSERNTLVSRMKADQQMRQDNLTKMVSQMMGKQAASVVNAGDNDIWNFLAKGEFTVSEDVKIQAQKDIAEDGYWGVQQTSQRLFDFASALAGDNEETLKQMEEAMEKGFKQALSDWGSNSLPQLSQDTMEAARQLFSDHYANSLKEVGVAVNV